MGFLFCEDRKNEKLGAPIQYSDDKVPFNVLALVRGCNLSLMAIPGGVCLPGHKAVSRTLGSCE